MPFAALAYVDDALAQRVGDIWKTLADRGVSRTPTAFGARPHLTLGVCDELDLGVYAPILQTLAEETLRFPIVLASFGVLLQEPSIVFLSPVVSARLLQMHKQFWLGFQVFAQKPVDSFRPDAWAPRCDLAADLHPDHVGRALDACRRFSLPLQGKITELGVVSLSPVKPLCGFELATIDPLTRGGS